MKDRQKNLQAPVIQTGLSISLLHRRRRGRHYHVRAISITTIKGLMYVCRIVDLQLSSNFPGSSSPTAI
jgi:hypothetical protein